MAWFSDYRLQAVMASCKLILAKTTSSLSLVSHSNKWKRVDTRRIEARSINGSKACHYSSSVSISLSGLLSLCWWYWFQIREPWQLLSWFPVHPAHISPLFLLHRPIRAAPEEGAAGRTHHQQKPRWAGDQMTIILSGSIHKMDEGKRLVEKMGGREGGCQGGATDGECAAATCVDLCI